MEYLRYIAIIILIALIIIRMMPVKGINKITTEKLKEERKKRINNLLMCELHVSSKPNTSNRFKTFHSIKLADVHLKSLIKTKKLSLFAKPALEVNVPQRS